MTATNEPIPDVTADRETEPLLWRAQHLGWHSAMSARTGCPRLAGFYASEAAHDANRYIARLATDEAR